MKDRKKKAVAVLLIMAVLFGTVQVTQKVAVQAASKLTKEDFKFTGKYKYELNEVIKGKRGYVLCTKSGEKNPKKCIKTKRGITLTSTKNQVFKKYGKVSVKKLEKKTEIYENLKNLYNKFKKNFNVIKNEKCAIYTYESESDTFNIRFFFDKKNKVNAILVSYNR